MISDKNWSAKTIHLVFSLLPVSTGSASWRLLEDKKILMRLGFTLALE
jgi:hypothetical protein